MIRAAAFALCTLVVPATAQNIPAEVLYTMMPAPLAGWQTAPHPEAADLGTLFGGSLASQNYIGPEGSFQLMFLQGGPVAETIQSQFAQPALLAGMGELMEIDGLPFLHQNDIVTGVLGDIVVQSSGLTDAEPVFEHLRTLDLSEIAATE